MCRVLFRVNRYARHEEGLLFIKFSANDRFVLVHRFIEKISYVKYFSESSLNMRKVLILAQQKPVISTHFLILHLGRIITTEV